MIDECKAPPAGWRCKRGAGHEGPCAAVPDGPVRGAWKAALPSILMWAVIGALAWWARS